jgi:hypothetical protein
VVKKEVGLQTPYSNLAVHVKYAAKGLFVTMYHQSIYQFPEVVYKTLN